MDVQPGFAQQGSQQRSQKATHQALQLQTLQCCNHKYQVLGNPNIRDQVHCKHRSETSSKIARFKLFF